VQLRDLLQAIDAATSDTRIARIVLIPDQMSAGISTMREIGQALDRFRAARKDVVVVSEGMEQGQYYLAAHADQILLDPQGSVMLEGFANYRSYYRDALDKLGVDVHLIRVGQYKSAGEHYILNRASDAAKEADLFWMGGIWNGSSTRSPRCASSIQRARERRRPARRAGPQFDGDLAGLARIADSSTARHAHRRASCSRDGQTR
jgi:protease-4